MKYSGSGSGNQLQDVKSSVDQISTPYTFRTQTVGGFIYYGVAAVGSVTSGSVWRVFRETESDGTILYADGDANFDNIWDNRTSLTYS